MGNINMPLLMNIVSLFYNKITVVHFYIFGQTFFYINLRFQELFRLST